MAEEIELKLVVAPQDLEALQASGLLTLPARKTCLVSAYFDTADHKLRQKGISLRVRRSSAGFVQTIKRPEGGSGIFLRQEWEMPVSACIPEPDPRMPLEGIVGDDELVPLFNIRTQRRKKQLSRGKSKVELAIDAAEIRAGERSSEFCEIEFECLAGSPVSLFALAREIGKLVPARISVLSKAERGFRLLDASEQEQRAEEVKLDPSMEVMGAFAAIVRSCLRQYRINEDILLEVRSAPAVHQARIALRRLRAAIRFARPLLRERQASTVNARLRNLALRLGPARDLDVLISEVPPGALHDKLRGARDRAYDAMEKALADPATGRLMQDISAWLAALPPAEAIPLEAFAADVLDRWQRKLRRHGKHLANLSEENRHRLRKDVKKLRYAVDFFGTLFPGSGRVRLRRKFAKRLGALQDELGALNDIAVAQRRLTEFGLTDSPDAQKLLARWDRRRLLRKATASRHELLDLEPFWR